MQKLKFESFNHLTEGIIKRLAQNRINTVLDFLEEEVTKLTAITSLTLPQVLDIRSQIFTKYSAPLVNGNAILRICLTKKQKISTGISRLDTTIGGGIPTVSITEICGLADSGKTQLAIQLAINIVKESSMENTVLYVDTKGDFSAVRVQKILENNNFSHKEMAEFMCRIRIVHIWIIEELIDLFRKVKDGTVKLNNLSLIIIDSLPCLMFQHLGDENKVGLSFLNTLVNYSRYLSTELNIAVIFVNIQTRWVDNDTSDLEGDGEGIDVPKENHATEKRNRCLGKYWQRIPSLVLQLEKLQSNSIKSGNSEQFKVLVIKSFNTELENNQCILNVSFSGIT